MSRKLLLTLAFAAIVTQAFAADYQTNLGPMPLDDETKLVIGGRGEATASSDGKTMTVKGSFHGLFQCHRGPRLRQPHLRCAGQSDL